MASGKITKNQISALARPASGKNFPWDDKVSGFGAYRTPSGRISYVLQYRMGGRGTPTRRYTIGRHGSPWPPESARRRAIDLLFEIHRGIDPLQREKVERETQQYDERLKFEKYFPLFMELHVEKRKLKSAKDIRRTIERDLLPYFADKTLGSITRPAMGPASARRASPSHPTTACLPCRTAQSSDIRCVISRETLAECLLSTHCGHRIFVLPDWTAGAPFRPH